MDPQTSAATSTVHVVSYPWGSVWRGPADIASTRRALASEPTVRFAVVGRSSGGSGTRDVSRSLSLRRLVAVVQWSDAATAAAGRARLDERWAGRGAHAWSAGLAPLRAHGTWRGVAAFAPDGEPLAAGAPASTLVASLTYARIRPSKMAHFYLLAFPRTARRITGPASPLLAAIGFGDVAVRHACTFSVWPSAALLDEVAHGQAEVHGVVARRSIQEGWLSESLFARFAVLDHHGTWGPHGDPLTGP